MNVKIRNKSMSVLKDLGITVPEHLPLLDDNMKLKDTREIVSRGIALHYLLAASFGMDINKVTEIWRSLKVESSITDREFLLLKNNEGIQLRPLIESEKVLAWFLGLSKDLNYTQYAENELVEQFDSVNVNALMKKIEVRSFEEVMSQLDLYYLLDWIVTNATINGMDSPLKVAQYLIKERRRALEWLLSTDGWDQVDMNT